MGIFKKPSLKVFGAKKKDMPEGLWQKCPECGAMVHQLELAENLRVCGKCEHHFSLTGRERIEATVDPQSFEEMDAHLEPVDALQFLDYASKLKKNQEKTGLCEAIVTGRARIAEIPILVGAMDFRFLGASMGSVVGEKIARAVETATRERKSVIIFSASGGARMHEGILSLMQMAKTSAALSRHHAAGLAYISVLTNPTYGGVTASYATLGDVNLAEPKTMVGFAGPRVIKETTHQDLPDGFQTAEFLLEHGLIDRIVSRSQMRKELAQLLRYFQRI